MHNGSFVFCVGVGVHDVSKTITLIFAILFVAYRLRRHRFRRFHHLVVTIFPVANVAVVVTVSAPICHLSCTRPTPLNHHHTSGSWLISYECASFAHCKFSWLFFFFFYYFYHHTQSANKLFLQQWHIRASHVLDEFV